MHGGHRWSKKLPTGELQNITESKPGWQPHLKRDKENKKTNKHPETSEAPSPPGPAVSLPYPLLAKPNIVMERRTCFQGLAQVSQTEQSKVNLELRSYKSVTCRRVQQTGPFSTCIHT